MKQKRKMYLFISLVSILVVITCFLIFYYSKRTVEYSLERVISCPENSSNLFYTTPIWSEMPDEYTINLHINGDSAYFYIKEYITNLDFTKNAYILSNQRKITSIYWSPHLADKYYRITDCQFLPVYLKFDTVRSNNIYVYKLKKNKYRLLVPF